MFHNLDVFWKTECVWQILSMSSVCRYLSLCLLSLDCFLVSLTVLCSWPCATNRGFAILLGRLDPKSEVGRLIWGIWPLVVVPSGVFFYARIGLLIQ
jgi:hypothetical protein